MGLSQLIISVEYVVRELKKFRIIGGRSKEKKMIEIIMQGEID